MANATTMREIHANLVNQFEEAWIEGRRPAISEMISEQVADGTALLTDLVDLEMEFRWKTGEPFQVERYFETYPELTNDKKTAYRLVRKEWELRRRTNQSPTFADYEQRFPEFAEALAGDAQPMPLDKWFGGSRPSAAATRQIFSNISERVHRALKGTKQRFPDGADAAKSKWLTAAIQELIDKTQFASDNRALANELFARWASSHETQSDPHALFLGMAESIRNFLYQRAEADADAPKDSGRNVAADVPETTLAFVLANPKAVCERDTRWEQLRRTSKPHVYQVNMLGDFAGRKPNEIAAILDLSEDEVDLAIREGERLLQVN